jgi:hypothetical protein
MPLLERSVYFLLFCCVVACLFVLSVPAARPQEARAAQGGAPEAAAWRGRYDPTTSAASSSSTGGFGGSFNGQKRPYDGGSGSSRGDGMPPAKKNIFESTSSSFGGMGRRR